MSRYIALFLMIGLLLVSCGTSRFFFNSTEKTITELGGTYNKEVGEELEKVYKNGDIDDVIEMVYQSDYTGGDPYVVVEGYLGEEPFEEFKKRVKEIKKEIENLWKGVDLEKDQIGGNEGLALAVLDETYPEGLVIEALGGLDNKNTQDFKNLLDQKYALRDELRGILSQSGIEGIKEAIVNEEYTEEEIEAYLGKSTLDEVKSTINTFELNQELAESNDIEIKLQEYQYLTNMSPDDASYIVGISSPIYKSFEVDGETVFRWVECSITEYDTEGNEIHFINSSGYEYWQEYDANGNVIFFRDSEGDESWQEYDANGNEIYYKYKSGALEGWKLYDAKGNCIYHRYLIDAKSISGSNSISEIEIWMEYDSKGNEIHSKDMLGNESWTEYDVKGNIIHYKDSYGYESWNEYDENYNCIHFKNSDGYESWNEYDDNGNCIHFMDSEGYEYWKYYDSDNNEVYFKSTFGEEIWTEYKYHENGVISKRIDYCRF